jgi:hypothetical protein
MIEIKVEQAPYWYLLLDQWVNNDNNSGLTIPFIIGAKHTYITKEIPDENAIRILFEEIMAVKDLPYLTGLTYCNTIQAYILTLVDRREIEDRAIVGSHGQPSLLLLNQVFGDEVPFDWITNFMTSEYSEVISEGKYSRMRLAFGGWEKFSENDILQIEKSLNK